MTDEQEKKKVLEELLRRKEKHETLERYKADFLSFAEENLKIITKDVSKGFVPFKLNKSQREITRILEEQRKETGRVRAIILKARQQGISTYCAGRVFWKTYFTPYSKSVVMAHDSATSDALFDMSRNVIKNMDEEFKPELKKSNAKEIILGHNDASYRLYTAGSPEAGRGTTPTIAHLSEVAFWNHDEKILAGLFQGISQAEGTEVILESTANGAQGEFYRLWNDAVEGISEYVPIFLPWFWTDEYTREVPEGFELSSEDEEYMEKYELSMGQMYWRHLKILEGGSEKFRQEYPASAEEAFLVSGNNVFDIDKLNEVVPTKPLKEMDFNDLSKFFEEKKGGELRIFRHKDFDEPFIVAADVAMGIGQDYSTAVVLSPGDNEVVALYRNNYIDPSKFGEVLFYLGRQYNNALMAVESNNMGVATLHELVRMGYVNLYYQTKASQISTEEGMRPGFSTTRSSKDLIIGNLKRAIVEEDIIINSSVLLRELKDYVSDDNGRMSAIDGSHDDSVIATAIAWEVLRTHRDKLVHNRVPWSQRIGSFQQVEENWI